MNFCFKQIYFIVIIYYKYYIPNKYINNLTVRINILINIHNSIISKNI